MRTFLVLLVLALPAYADIIVLKTGRTIEGEIIEDNEKQIVVKVKYGKIKLPKHRIMEITRTGKPESVKSGPQVPKKVTGTNRGNPSPTPSKLKKVPGQKPACGTFARFHVPGPAAPILAQYKLVVSDKEDLLIEAVNKYRKKLLAKGKPVLEELMAIVSNNVNEKKDWKLRYLALNTLRWMKDPDSIPCLIKTLNDTTVLEDMFTGMASHRSGKYWFRKNAALALKEIGPKATSRLKMILADCKHDDYLNAIYALGIIGGPRVHDILAKIAEDTSQTSAARREAARAMAGRGKKSGETLSALLSDETVGQAVAEALKESENKDAIPYLLQKVRGAAIDFRTAETAAKLISSITQGKFEADNASDGVDYMLLAGKVYRHCLPSAHGKEAIPRLEFWMNSNQPEMCKHATEVMAKLKKRLIKGSRKK